MGEQPPVTEEIDYDEHGKRIIYDADETSIPHDTASVSSSEAPQQEQSPPAEQPPREEEDTPQAPPTTTTGPFHFRDEHELLTRALQLLETRQLANARSLGESADQPLYGPAVGGAPCNDFQYIRADAQAHEEEIAELELTVRNSNNIARQVVADAHEFRALHSQVVQRLQRMIAELRVVVDDQTRPSSASRQITIL